MTSPPHCLIQSNRRGGSLSCTSRQLVHTFAWRDVDHLLDVEVPISVQGDFMVMGTSDPRRASVQVPTHIGNRARLCFNVASQPLPIRHPRCSSSRHDLFPCRLPDHVHPPLPPQTLRQVRSDDPNPRNRTPTRPRAHHLRCTMVRQLNTEPPG